MVCEKESKKEKKKNGKSGTVETEVGKLNLLCDILRAQDGRGRREGGGGGGRGIPLTDRSQSSLLFERHFQDVRRNFFPSRPSILLIRVTRISRSESQEPCARNIHLFFFAPCHLHVCA